ncbi:MAG: gamma-glutamyltransferase family protein [Pseudomonadota bacterium]
MRDFHSPGRSAVFAAEGMCATSHPFGARIAIETLQAGGNAADAAIASAVAMGLCEPHMTGIGGDCFVLLKPAGEDRLYGLNGSGRAPAGLSAAALRAEGLEALPGRSPQAVTVPGAVDAFDHLSRRWGRLGLADCLAPAIHYAEAGVPIAPRVAFDWATIGPGHFWGPGAEVLRAHGRAPRPGTLFQLPAQAAALRRIAAEGRDGFYTGPVAEDMVAALRAVGGPHTLDDFAATRCDEVEPVAGSYRGAELWELPPNGQGAAAILLAQMLEHFDLADLDPLGPERVHLEAEATKLAYDARNRFIADPSRVDVPTDRLIAKATAERLAADIRPDALLADPAPLVESVHRDTIYLVVVDGEGMAVSLIYSLFHGFGSGIVSERYNILLHSRGAGFTLEEGHPNEARPGHRPMHTIIPAFLKTELGEWMPFGVMGGAYQATGHARFVSNLVDYGLDLQSAIDGPRAFWDDGTLKIERGYDDATRQALIALGHRIAVPEIPIGGAQAIRIRKDGVLEGASDPRKDGCALGY